MSTLVVETDKILSNLKIMRNHTNVPVIPVLKGNAYGLGDVAVARLLVEKADVHLLAVSRLEEAARLKEALPDEEIFLLSPYSTESEAAEIVRLGLTATVGSYGSAVLLNGFAEKAGVRCRVHLKFDTGLGRSGFLPEESEKAVQAAKYLKSLEIAGCFSHLSNCFGKDVKGVTAQLDHFQNCVAALRNAGVEPGLLHIAASNAAILYPSTRLGAVRCGSALLGRVGVKNRLGLQRVGRLECPVADVRWLPAKHTVGYGNTYTTKKPARIATIQTGYADGLFLRKVRDAFRTRDILRDGWHDFKALLHRPALRCTINGQPALVIGRVGMCTVVVDVSNITCSAGDIASFDVNPMLINANVERVYR
ncbi:MAG: alanine racemase [Ethanoligenens sp.]